MSQQSLWPHCANGENLGPQLPPPRRYRVASTYIPSPLRNEISIDYPPKPQSSLHSPSLSLCCGSTVQSPPINQNEGQDRESHAVKNGGAAGVEASDNENQQELEMQAAEGHHSSMDNCKGKSGNGSQASDGNASELDEEVAAELSLLPMLTRFPTSLPRRYSSSSHSTTSSSRSPSPLAVLPAQRHRQDKDDEGSNERSPQIPPGSSGNLGDQHKPQGGNLGASAQHETAPSSDPSCTPSNASRQHQQLAHIGRLLYKHARSRFQHSTQKWMRSNGNTSAVITEEDRLGMRVIVCRQLYMRQLRDTLRVAAIGFSTKRGCEKQQLRVSSMQCTESDSIKITKQGTQERLRQLVKLRRNKSRILRRLRQMNAEVFRRLVQLREEHMWSMEGLGRASIFFHKFQNK